jgi:hypothetical protein
MLLSYVNVQACVSMCMGTQTCKRTHVHVRAPRWRDISAPDKESLRTMNCIPVGGELVKPSRVFFRVNGEYAPFMFELPRCFGAQEALMRELGVREVPSVADLTNFIYEVLLSAVVCARLLLVVALCCGQRSAESGWYPCDACISCDENEKLMLVYSARKSMHTRP